MAYIKGRTGLGAETPTVGFWQGILKGGIETFGNIAQGRWGTPAGVTYKQDPQTGVITSYARYPVSDLSVGVSAFPPMDFGSAGGDILKWGLIAAVIVGGVTVLKR